jgi:hypothetical protein
LARFFDTLLGSKRKKAMSRSDDVTLASLARAALAACGGNPETEAEYILVQVMKDRKLLRSILLPTIKDAIGCQIIPHAASANGNVIDPRRPVFRRFFRHGAPQWRPLG